MRYLTLTHFTHNVFADSCGVSKVIKPPNHGLRYGFILYFLYRSTKVAAVVRSANACPRTQLPLIPCQPLVHTLCDISRNVPDDVLWQVGTTATRRCDTVLPLSQRRTSYALKRDLHGRRIGMLSNTGQLLFRSTCLSTLRLSWTISTLWSASSTSFPSRSLFYGYILS